MAVRRHCIEIDRELLASVKKANAFKTNSETVAFAMRSMIEATERDAESRRLNRLKSARAQAKLLQSTGAPTP